MARGRGKSLAKQDPHAHKIWMREMKKTAAGGYKPGASPHKAVAKAAIKATAARQFKQKRK